MLILEMEVGRSKEIVLCFSVNIDSGKFDNT